MILFLQHLRTEAKSSLSLIQKNPKIYYSILFIFSSLLTIGLVLVIELSNSYAESNKKYVADSTVAELKESIEGALEQSRHAATTAGNFLLRVPECSVLKASFPQLSMDIIETYTDVEEIQFYVSNIVGFDHGFVYPPFPDDLEFLYGFDKLNPSKNVPPKVIPPAVINKPPTVEQEKNYIKGGMRVYLLGPLMLPVVGLTIVTHYPIWKHADNYTVDLGCNVEPFDCQDVCWNNTSKLKYFGTVAILLKVDELLESVFRHVGGTGIFHFRLSTSDSLDPDDYNYEYRNSVMYTSASAPLDPIVTEISHLNIHWILETWLSNGWYPQWYTPMIIAVCLVSFFLTLVATRLMVLHERHAVLIRSMLPEKVIHHLELGLGIYAENFDTVTVMFADIVGYTVVCSSLTPHQVVMLLDDLYKVFDKLAAIRGVYKGITLKCF